MGWFLRNIDEPEDESRLPRRVVLGVLGVGVAAVLGMILIAVGLASFMAARHRGGSTASRSISPPQPSPPPIASKSSSPTHAAKTVAWRVRADPKRIAPLPSIEPPGLLTLAPAEKLVFPSTPSVFAVSDPESPALPHRVWNLATAEPVGAIRVR